MLTQIAFVRIAVPDLDQGLRFYRDALGLPEVAHGYSDQFGAQTAILGLGGSRILLLEPDAADSPTARFLAERRGGVISIGLGSDAFGSDAAAFAAGNLAARGEPLVETGLGAVLPLRAELLAGLPLEITSRVTETASGTLLERLDHVATVVSDLNAAVAQFGDHFGVQPDPEVSYLDFSDLQTRNAMMRFGPSWIEFNQSFSDQTMFGQHFARFGSSALGLALEVVDLEAALAHLDKAGVGYSPPTPVWASHAGGDRRAMGIAAVPSSKASLGCRLFLIKANYQ